MRAPLLTALGVALAATPAAADREMCTRGVKYRGASMDLDVKAADLKDVLRLLADVGKVNLVVPDDVSGRVTLRLARVPWDQVLCTVAAAHKLTITVRDGILMVARKR